MLLLLYESGTSESALIMVADGADEPAAGRLVAGHFGTDQATLFAIAELDDANIRFFPAMRVFAGQGIDPGAAVMVNNPKVVVT